MAELSNDPLGQLNPALTFQINHLGSVALAKTAKQAGVQRFIYMSSCSVYGIGGDAPVDEAAVPNPQTAYAECKMLVERDVSALADETFAPTFLRNATAFGASPRMRFDIVLNNLSGLAWTTGKIAMTSDGTPWRPLVHILDIADAIGCVLDAPRETIYNQVFNVGSDRQNYRVREIAEIVAETFLLHVKLWHERTATAAATVCRSRKFTRNCRVLSVGAMPHLVRCSFVVCSSRLRWTQRNLPPGPIRGSNSLRT